MIARVFISHHAAGPDTDLASVGEHWFFLTFPSHPCVANLPKRVGSPLDGSNTLKIWPVFPKAKLTTVWFGHAVPWVDLAVPTP